MGYLPCKITTEQGVLMKPVVFFIWSVLAIFPFGAGAQNGPKYRFVTFTPKRGLPVSKIFEAQRDAAGFLWLATAQGIIRFDGQRYQTYYLPNQGDASNNYQVIVQVICQGNRVICLNRTGHLFELDLPKDAFVPLPLRLPGFEHTKVDARKYGLTFDASRNCFWFRDFRGFYQVDITSGQITTIREYAKPLCSDVLLDEQGKLWSTTNEGLWKYDPETRKQSLYFKGTYLSAICAHKNMVYAVGDMDSLFFMDINTGRTRSIATNRETFFGKRQPDCAMSMRFWPTMQAHWQLWMGTCSNGVVVLSPDNGEFQTQYNTVTNADAGMPGNWVNHLSLASNQLLWVSTDAGLAQLDPAQLDIKTEKVPLVVASNAVRIRQVLRHATRPDLRWVSTANGLFIYDIYTKKIKELHLADKSNPGKQPERWLRINIMKTDPQGNLWVGTHGGMAWVAPDFKVRNFADPQVRGVAEFEWAGKDSFWVLNEGEIGLFIPQTHTYFPARLWDTSKEVFKINAGIDGAILFCNDSFLFRLYPTALDTNCRCFPHPEVLFTYKGGSDFLETDTCFWLLAPGGLSSYHKARKDWLSFGADQGLSNPRIRSLVQGDSGILWMNSDNGLFAFFPQYGRFKRFSDADGLAENFIPGILTLDDDEIRAGFSESYSSFPKSYALQTQAVPPVITGVYALDQRLHYDPSQPDNSPIVVRYDQNILRFEFTSPDFYQSDKITFRCQLEGFDPQPRFLGTERFAVYTNLDGGHYRFKVWAINADGFECAQPAVLQLRVIPPYYRTWWFYLLVLLLLTGVIYALFHYREMQRLRREQLRLRIARDLHDEVGSTLSAISILSEASLAGLQKDLDRARFSNIGDIARTALERMSDIVWAINPQNDQLAKIIERLTQYTVETLEPLGMAVYMDIDNTVLDLQVPMEIRKEFYLICKEAIHNCAKHSQATEVAIRIQKNAKGIEFQISDNGRGIPPEVLHTTRGMGGNGLKNMQARAQAIQARLKIAAPESGGTLLLLQVPL
jgi:ligand-binding sensor domain-containing protein